MTLFSSLVVFFTCHGSLVRPLAFVLCWSSRGFSRNLVRAFKLTVTNNRVSVLFVN